MTNGPQLWRAMLEAINRPGTVIAGGCIRDNFLSIPHKDIDIFVSCSDMDDWLKFKYEYCLQTGLMDVLDTQEGLEYDKTDFGPGDLYGVLEGTMLDEQVNIIARFIPEGTVGALIETFDFGILQAYYDGERVGYTKASWADNYLRRATLMHTKHWEQSRDRFMRFNNRNPGVLSLNVPYTQEQLNGGEGPF